MARRRGVSLSDLAPEAAARVVAGLGVTSGPAEGRFVEGFWVSLPFPPRSKANARRYRPGRGRSGDDWSSLRDFEERVAAAVRAAVPEGWPVGDGPVRSRPPVVVVIVARALLDVSNLPKSVHDAVEGVVYRTDASVVASAEVVERARKGQGAVVAFARLAPGASPQDAATAVADLLEVAVARFADHHPLAPAPPTASR